MIANKVVLVVLLAVASWKNLPGAPVRRGRATGLESSVEARARLDHCTRTADSLAAWIRESDRQHSQPDAPWREAIVARLHAAQIRRVEEIRQSFTEAAEPERVVVRLREAISSIVRDQRRKEQIFLSEHHDEGGSE